jgi:hypothetical protein
MTADAQLQVAQLQVARLHVDRLVLHGFSPLQAQRVRDAFVAALARAPAPTAGPRGVAGAPAHRDTLRLSVPDAGSPEALGRAAAQAVLRSLSTTDEPAE